MAYNLFVGNPGAGKSTTCNALLGESVFESGLSVGSGLTTVRKEVPWNHDGKQEWVCDTPGLADVTMKKEAAKQIELALKTPHPHKLFFVCTLEAGRVRPSDIETINCVIDCMPEPPIYGIIVTKVSKKAMTAIAGDVQKLFIAFSELKRMIPPRCFHFVLKDDNADDEKNALLGPECSVPLKAFVTTFPEAVIKQVNEIKTDEYKQKVEEMEQRLAAMQKDDKKRAEVTADLERRLKEAEERAKTVMPPASDTKKPFWQTMLEVALPLLTVVLRR